VSTLWLRTLLSLTVLFYLPAIHAAEDKRTMALASCRFADLTRAARCGTLSVPENPDKPGGRRLSISVAVIPATHARALSDPIVVLFGPETQSTFLGDYRVRQQQAACKEWPARPLPKDYREPVVSAVPTLFVSGEADGGTPLWYADRVAAGFSNHLQVIVKGQGHTEWSDCLAQLYLRLVRGGAVNGLSSSCPEVPRPPFKLT
jgi:pimeloyl-ACP methyl ester carboxylesterase